MNNPLLLVLAAGASLGAVGLIRGWRSEATSDYYKMPPLWPWGEAAWNGFRRNELVAEALAIVLVVYVASPQFAPVLGLLTFGLLIPAAIAIFLFNWPSILVPPALREQPGFMTAMWRRSRT